MKKQIVLVTGAAGGIGEAVVRVLAERGATVAAVDRDKARLDEVVEHLRIRSLDVWGFPADVTDAAEVDATVSAVERLLGPLDSLVNAAGVLRLGSARELTDEQWEHT